MKKRYKLTVLTSPPEGRIEKNTVHESVSSWGTDENGYLAIFQTILGEDDPVMVAIYTDWLRCFAEMEDGE